MQTFRNAAAYGNQFIRKYLVPYADTLDYMYKKENVYNISEGPVRSGKTTDNIIMFCQTVEESNEILFLTIGVDQPSAKTILWEGDGLGISHYPDWQERYVRVGDKRVYQPQRIFKTKYQGKDALALLPKHGSDKSVKYIIAFGGSKTNDREGYKGMSIGAWIATQWELLHYNTRDELVKRTIGSKLRRHYIDLNPISPNAEIYKEFDRWESKGLVNYKLKLMNENPFLTKERIDQIMQEYDPDSVSFQRDILGKRVAATGTIYTIRDYNLIDKFDVNDYYDFVIVADIGETNSATVFILAGITKDFQHFDVIKEYYHRNVDQKDAGIKLVGDYAEDYLKFINECFDIIGRIPTHILSDNDISFVREFNRQKYKHDLGSVFLNHTFGKSTINERVRDGLNKLYKGRLRFRKSCKYTIQAFKTAEYDPKAKDKGEYARLDEPDKGTMIDPIDAVEYGILVTTYLLDRYKGV